MSTSRQQLTNSFGKKLDAKRLPFWFPILRSHFGSRVFTKEPIDLYFQFVCFPKRIKYFRVHLWPAPLLGKSTSDIGFPRFNCITLPLSPVIFFPLTPLVGVKGRFSFCVHSYKIFCIVFINLHEAFSIPVILTSTSKP